MKILLVSSFLPYPLFSGGHIRLYNIIKGLSKNHEITLVCEKRDYQTKEDINEVEKFCKKVKAVDRKKQWTFSNIIKTLISTNPFLIVGHTNEALKQTIVDLLNSEKFDLIHVETSYIMQDIPPTDIPLVLVEHNIEYLVYERFARIAPLFLRPLLYIDVLKLKIWEERIWTKATKLVSVSESEKKIMSKKRKDVVVVSNGVDIQKFRVKKQESGRKNEEKRVLFIGDFKWVQNRDAIEWILKEIWPKIKMSFWSEGESRAIESHQRKKDAIALLQHDVSLTLWVVGRKIPKNIKDMGDESVILDEDASSDTSLIYQKADVLLAPIRVGGGTSFKILEAMASGVPVVTTNLGIEGIGVRDKEEVLLGEDADGLARQTLNVLQNNDIRIKLIKNARKLIEERYDWRSIVKKLEGVYKSAIK